MNSIYTSNLFKSITYRHALLFAASLIFFTGCSKLQGTVSPTTAVKVHSSTSDSFQPVIATSYWIYKVTQGETSDTSTVTMTGTTTTYNNRMYYNASVNYRSHRFPNTQTYFWSNNHIYNNLVKTATDTLEQYYFNDITTLNGTWTAKANASGYVDGKPARYVGTLVEQNISLTIEGMTFTGVNHSKIYLQYGNEDGSFTTDKIIDVFVVKGIGEIEKFVQDSSDNIISQEELLEYSVK